MADLGAIGDLYPCSFSHLYTAEISGIVNNELGMPTRHLIRAYDRPSGSFSGSAHSDPATGEYLLPLRIDLPAATEHTVVDLDTDSGDQYNARVFDRVIPIS